MPADPIDLTDADLDHHQAGTKASSEVQTGPLHYAEVDGPRAADDAVTSQTVPRSQPTRQPQAKW
jgi:hypothetical protein